MSEPTTRIFVNGESIGVGTVRILHRALRDLPKVEVVEPAKATIQAHLNDGAMREMLKHPKARIKGKTLFQHRIAEMQRRVQRRGK